MQRGLVNDAEDWYKYFKCSEIDPTVLPGEMIHRIRSEGLRKLILYKLFRYPRQTFTLLRRFIRYMPLRDVVYLIVKPFLGKKQGPTKAEVLSRAVEHADVKSAAADLTQLSDDALEEAIQNARAERAAIQVQAERERQRPNGRAGSTPALRPTTFASAGKYSAPNPAAIVSRSSSRAFCAPLRCRPHSAASSSA